MKKHIYKGLTVAVLLGVAAPSVFAQTNGGYIRETLRRDAATEGEMRINASTTVEASAPKVKASVDADITLREKASGLATGKRTSTSTATSTRKHAATAQAAEAARQEKRAEIETRIAQKKLVITSDMFTRIAERVARAAQRLEDAATKLAETSVMLRTRTTSIEERGADVTKVEGLLDEVDARILSFKLSIADISEDGELAAASTTPAKAWKAAHTDFKIVIAEVHAIRALLHDAVAALKDAARALGERGASAAVSSNASATTTTEATTTSE